MRIRLKKFVFGILVLGMCLYAGKIEVNAFAMYHHDPINDAVFENFKYVYNEEENCIGITEYIGNEKEVIVPSEINGVKVKYVFSFGDKVSRGMADQMEEKKNIRKIVFPEGIESISGLNFCGNIEYVSLPESLITIDNYTFENCKKLKNVKLPRGLKKIGEEAFFGCENLKSIEVPSGVKVIESGAFAGCIKLQNIKLSNGLKKIGWEAFSGCDSLKKIVIPDSVTKIDMGAFAYCRRLTTVKLSKNLKIIADEIFKGCRKIKAIEVPKSVTKIDYQAFCSTGLTQITIPSKVTYIGMEAFAECKNLKQITIKGTKIKTVKKRAFKNIKSTAVFDVPNKSIAKYKKLLTSKTGFKKTMRVK